MSGVKRVLTPELAVALTPDERLQLGEVLSMTLIRIVEQLTPEPLDAFVYPEGQAGSVALFDQPFSGLIDQLVAQQKVWPRACTALQQLHTAREQLQAIMLLPQLLLGHTDLPVQTLILALDRCGGTAVRWSPLARQAAKQLSIRLPSKRTFVVPPVPASQSAAVVSLRRTDDRPDDDD